MIAAIVLASITPIFFGLSRIVILTEGLPILAWFGFVLLVWQPRFDRTADMFADQWRNQGHTSSLGLADPALTSRGSTLCQICKKGPYRLGLGVRYHTRTVHKEYFDWYQIWIREIEIIAIATVATILVLAYSGLLDPLLASNYTILLLLVPALSIVSVFAGNRARKQAYWRKKGSGPGN